MIRLPKAIAQSGVTSRRKADEWVLEGRVTVNGRLITTPSTMVDPETDHIKVDGKRIRQPQKSVYLLLNKPRGVVSTLSDPEGRPTVVDLVKGIKGRVFPVGRLDFNTEGLLLFTNDGELAQRLLHPKYEVERVYLVKIKGAPPRLKDFERLINGVKVDPKKPPAKASAKIYRKLKANTWLEMTLKEGRNREVRRICERMGYTVLALRRVRFGPLEIKDLPVGRCRPLTDKELELLKIKTETLSPDAISGGPKKPSQNVMRAGKARQNPTKKRSI